MLLLLATARAEPFVGVTAHGFLPVVDYLPIAPYYGLYAGVTFPNLGFEVRGTWTDGPRAEIPYQAWAARVDGTYRFAPDARVDPVAVLGGGYRSAYWTGSPAASRANRAGLAEEPAVTGFLEAGAGVAIGLFGPLYARVDARGWGGISMLLHGDTGAAGAEASLALEVRFRGRPRDADGDGLADAEDACPERAEDFDHLLDHDGCPEDDVDGDGTPDTKDRCPTQREVVNGYEDLDGCPDVAEHAPLATVPRTPRPAPPPEPPTDAPPEPPPAPAAATPEMTSVTEWLGSLYFVSGSAQVSAESEPAIAHLADLMRAHPNARVEVRVRAVTTGPDSADQALSQARAEALVARFVAHGLDAARFTAVGVGEAKLLADDAPSSAPKLSVEIQLTEGAPP